MVIQIRGTSGSGKTWIIKSLMEMYNFVPIHNTKSEIQGYYSKEINLFIVGKYTTACGGCDTIKSQDEVIKRVKKAVSKKWNVLFEGLICSHIAKRYADLYAYLKNIGIVFICVFLTTPLNKCRNNINIRRKKSGKPPVRAKNTEKDYISTFRSRENMYKMGVPKKNMPKLSSVSALDYICTKIGGIKNE